MTDPIVQNESVPALDDSILNTIKKMIGYDKSFTDFDMDLMIHINTNIATLTQLGVGNPLGFSVTGDTETWTTYLGEDPNLSSVKTYLYIKCKLIFDTPPTSFVIDALEKTAQEIEWRLNVTADRYVPTEVIIDE